MSNKQKIFTKRAIEMTTLKQIQNLLQNKLDSGELKQESNVFCRINLNGENKIFSIKEDNINVHFRVLRKEFAPFDMESPKRYSAIINLEPIMIIDIE